MYDKTRGTDAPSLTHKASVLISALHKERMKRSNLIF